MIIAISKRQCYYNKQNYPLVRFSTTVSHCVTIDVKMHSLLVAVLGCLILLTAQGGAHRIPKSLSIGCAAAAYQIEGACNVSGTEIAWRC